MSRSILLFYVTCPDETKARQLGEALLQRRLIACANYFPIGSAYWWQGTIEEEKEWVALFKTRIELEQKVEEAIAGLHPYQVPCILRFEGRANEAYANWIEDCTAASIEG